MDPQISTSFIPKEALTAQKARTGGIGLFFLLSLLVFVISLVSAGGVFAYTQLLNQQLGKNKSQLDLAKGAFEPSTIQNLVRLDSRIEQVKALLNKHVAPSALFNFLAQNTLSNVQFTSLDYALSNDGSATIQLDGTADSFSTIALQSDQMGKATGLKDVIFSGIQVETGNRVSFILHATVDPSLISYAKQQSLGTPPSAQ